MTRFRAKRLGQIISPELSPSIGSNIQGPSLIKAPQWLQQPLGKYYLYFADHKGDHIRLAYANDLVGPWSIYEPGSLQLTESKFLIEQPEENSERLALAQKRVANTPYPHDIRHDLEIPYIASPDVHIDEVNQQIVMYYQSLESYGIQLSRVATA